MMRARGINRVAVRVRGTSGRVELLPTLSPGTYERNRGGNRGRDRRAASGPRPGRPGRPPPRRPASGPRPDRRREPATSPLGAVPRRSTQNSPLTEHLCALECGDVVRSGPKWGRSEPRAASRPIRQWGSPSSVHRRVPALGGRQGTDRRPLEVPRPARQRRRRFALAGLLPRDPHERRLERPGRQGRDAPDHGRCRRGSFSDSSSPAPSRQRSTGRGGCSFRLTCARWWASRVKPSSSARATTPRSGPRPAGTTTGGTRGPRQAREGPPGHRDLQADHMRFQDPLGIRPSMVEER